MKKQRILFVDDDENVLLSYKRSLRGQRESWSMEFEVDPAIALQRIREESFDTVVTDMRMPGMSGLELLEQIKGDDRTGDVPVVIVTGEADKVLKRKALNLDAADLLNKPVESEDLIARLRSVLRTKQYADELKQNNELLEQRVQERTSELVASQVDILWRLGKAAEYRDEETGNHVIRVGSYSRVVASAMGMSDSFCDTLFLAAPLHDIGKIGVSDTVLLKPGKLTDEEWDSMRRHCEIGVSILTDECKFMHVAAKYSSQRVVGTLSPVSNNPIIEMAAEIAASHHEKWNGSGYPAGISGDSIPLVGRIVAIADVYDALRSDRPYKDAFTVERSLQIIRESSGSHFDPKVVAAFIDAYPQIEAIEREFSDEAAMTSQTAHVPMSLLTPLSWDENRGLLAQIE